MILSPKIQFSRPFPINTLTTMFDNSYITGVAHDHHDDRCQFRCEYQNYRAFFEIEYSHNSDDHMLVYFAIFEIRNGGNVWQLISYSLELDGTMPSFVAYSINLAIKGKRIQSGSNLVSDVLLWGTELPKLGIYPVIFDIETEKLIRPEAEHAPVMLNSERYCWVANNGNYHAPLDFHEPTFPYHTQGSPHHLNWYSGRPMHK